MTLSSLLILLSPVPAHAQADDADAPHVTSFAVRDTSCPGVGIENDGQCYFFRGEQIKFHVEFSHTLTGGSSGSGFTAQLQILTRESRNSGTVIKPDERITLTSTATEDTDAIVFTLTVTQEGFPYLRYVSVEGLSFADGGFIVVDGEEVHANTNLSRFLTSHANGRQRMPVEVNDLGGLGQNTIYAYSTVVNNARGVNVVADEVTFEGIDHSGLYARHGHYGAGDEIRVTIVFSREADLSGGYRLGSPHAPRCTEAGGEHCPVLDMELEHTESGDGTFEAPLLTPITITRYTKTYTFRYVVREGDRDTDGISVGAEALTINGQTLIEGFPDAAAYVDTIPVFARVGERVFQVAGLDTTLAGKTLTDGGSLANNPNFAVNGNRPHVTDITIEPPLYNSIYHKDEAIVFKAVMSHPVRYDQAATGADRPHLKFTINNPGPAVVRTATVTGTENGNRTLVFEYIVTMEDFDSNGISIEPGATTIGGDFALLDGTTTPVRCPAPTCGDGAVSAEDVAELTTNAYRVWGRLPILTIRAPNTVTEAETEIPFTISLSNPLIEDLGGIMEVGSHTRIPASNTHPLATAGGVDIGDFFPQGGDRSGFSGARPFVINAGEIQQVFMLEIKQDTILEGDESVYIVLHFTDADVGNPPVTADVENRIRFRSNVNIVLNTDLAEDPNGPIVAHRLAILDDGDLEAWVSCTDITETTYIPLADEHSPILACIHDRGNLTEAVFSESKAPGERSTIEFTVSVTPSAHTVTVQYETVRAGNHSWYDATPDVDFESLQGTLTINPGETRATITLTILEDAWNEYDFEDFWVALRNLRADAGTKAIHWRHRREDRPLNFLDAEAYGPQDHLIEINIRDNREATVTIRPEELTLDAGDVSHYAVVLDARPRLPVTITATSGNTATVTVSDALTFTTDDWDTEQTITVRVGDLPDDDDAADETITVTHGLASNDVLWPSSIPRDIAPTRIIVSDPDAASATIAPTALEALEGGEVSYTVVLDAEPGMPVTITATPDNAPGVSVGDALTFTAQNWNTEQTVTVRAPNDDDAGDETITVTHSVVSDDGFWTAPHLADMASVTIVVDDPDTAGVTISPTDLRVHEGGEVSYAVVLDARPTHPVTVTPRHRDIYINLSGPVTFNPDEWDQHKTVTVTAWNIDDADIDDQIITIRNWSSSLDPDYMDVDGGGGLIERRLVNVDLVITDATPRPKLFIDLATEYSRLILFEPDVPGVGDTFRDEDRYGHEWDNYRITMGGPPDADVTVTPVASDPAVVRPFASVVFTPDNWQTPQTLTILAVRDDDVDDETVTVSHQVTSAGFYDGLAVDYYVHLSVSGQTTPDTATEPDALTYIVRDAQHHLLSVNAPTATEGDGDAAVDMLFTVTLTPPIADAEVTFSYLIHERSRLIAGIRFPGEASSPLIPLPTHLQDADLAAMDADYQGTPAAVSTTLTAGQSAKIITLPILPDNRHEADELVYVFFSEPQATGGDAAPQNGYDNDQRRDRKVRFARSNTRRDSTYGVILDNDEAPTAIAMSASVERIGEGDGATEVTVTATLDGDATFDAPLTLEVTATGSGNDAAVDFTIAAKPAVASNTAPSGTPPASEAPFHLVIEPGASTAVITLVVTPEDDDLIELDETIILGIADSDADTSAPPRTPATLTLILTDNDTQGVTVPAQTLAVPERGEATYALVLNTRPTRPVTITPTSGNETWATVSGALTFDGGNWSTAQTVTVTGVADDDTLDQTSSVTHAVVSADAGYNALAIADGSIKVVDDDAPALTVTAPSASEADGTLIFTVGIRHADDQDATVGYETRDGTATAGTDYTALAPDILTIAAGYTAVEITVMLHDDARYEGAETLTLHLSNPSNAALPRSGADHPGTITDSDVKPGIALSVSEDEVDEGDGAAQITITATLDAGATFDAPRTLSITLSGSGEADVVDFMASRPRDLVIAAGATTATTTATLTPTDDGDDELNEVVAVTGADRHASDPATVRATAITLYDDDRPAMAVLNHIRINEGATYSYGAVFSKRPVRDVSVRAVSPDVRLKVLSPDLAFTKEAWEDQQSIQIKAEQDDDAADDTITVTYAASLYAPSLSDTRPLPPGTGGRPGDPGGAGPVGAAPGRLAGGDMAAHGPRGRGATMTFFHGAPETARQGDRSETPTARSDPLAAFGETVITIIDDDPVAINVSASTLTVAAGGTGAYTVVLTSAPTPANSTVTITPASADAAVADVSAPVQFDASNWNDPQTITVTGIDIGDADTLDSTVQITHAVAHVATDGDYADATAAAVTVTVTDPDVPTITVTGDTATEAANAELVFTVRIPAIDDQDVTLTYATAAVPATEDYGAATADDDYTAKNGALTIAAGATSELVTVAVLNDGIYEGEERFALQLSAPTNGTLSDDGSAHGIIDDDETAATGIALDVSPTSVAEDAAATVRTLTVTATLQGANPLATASTVTVSFSDSATASDPSVVRYTNPADAEIVIAAGTTVATTTFVLTLFNDNIGGQEPATVTVSGTEASGLPVTSATFAVTDDDDPPEAITLSVSTNDLSEATPSQAVITVTATLDGTTRFAQARTVTLSLGGTATADADYTHAHDPLPSIAIAAGAGSGTAAFTLTVADDDFDEADPETILVGGTVTEASSLTVAAASIALADNDGAGVTVSTTTVSVAAGGSGTYNVSLQSRPTHSVTVALTVTGDDDAATITPSSLTFPTSDDWDDPIAVTITDSDDADTWIDTLSIAHAFTSTDGNYDGASASTVTATVADADQPTLSMSVTGATEGDGGGVQFAVRLSADDQESRVSYATSNGTATAGADYDAASGTLTFAAGETSKTVTVNVRDDTVHEGDETLTLTLTNPHNAALPEDAALAGTITDNDAPATGTRIEVSRDTLSEGAGATSVTITVRLTGGAPFTMARTFTVSFTAPVEASNPAVVRYAALEDITLIIAPGTSVQTATVTLTPVADNIGGQASALIAVSGTETTPPDGLSALPVASATLTITDDDAVPSVVALGISTAELAEDAGEKTLTVTATVQGGNRFAVSRTVTLSLAGSATAGAGNDYTHGALPTIDIGAGAVRAEAELTITVLEDHLDEGNGETITLAGTVAGNPPTTVTPATINLTDNDGAGIVVSPTTVTATEGGDAVTYGLVLKSRPTHAVAIAFRFTGADGAAAAAGAAEIRNNPQTITFLPSGWNTAQSVTVTAPQDDDTHAHELTIEHHAVTSDDEDYDGATAANVTVRVEDDDAPQLSVSVTNATEGAEDARVVFVVSLTADDQEARVSYTTSNGTATAGADYDQASGELVFAAGETRKTVTVPVRDDDIYEGDETLKLTLSAPVNASLSGGANFEGRILDDETAATGIELAVNPSSVSEGGGAAEVVVTAALTSDTPFAVARTVQVSFAPPVEASEDAQGTASMGAEVPDSPNTRAKSVVRYEAQDNVTITIAAATTMATVTVTLTPVDDIIGGQANAVIAVSGTEVEHPSNLPELLIAQATLKITDDDAAPTGIALAVDPSSLFEGDGATDIEVKATVNGATRFAADRVVTLIIGGGTATGSGTDYQAATPSLLTIAAGQASGTATISLTPNDDDFDEAEETIRVTGTVDAEGVSGAYIDIALADNDTATVAVSRNAASVPAGGAASYQVSLQSRPTHPVTVSLDVPSQDAATVAPARLVFPPTDAWNAPIDVTITDADDADALIDEFVITHSVTSTDPNYDGASASSVTATVADDDVPMLSVSASHATEGAENARARFVVRLTPADDQEARVSYTTSNGTATAGADYDATSGTLTFAAGETHKTVTVNVRDDNAYEGTEMLSLTLSAPVNASLPESGPSFSANIADDETAPTGIVLAVSPTTVVENAAAAARRVTVTATLQGANPLATARTITVSFSDPVGYTSVDAQGTASEGAEVPDSPGTRALSVVRYAGIDGIELIIAAGTMQAEAEFVLAPVDDIIGGQADAAISVTGEDSGNLPVTAATLTIEDDDSEPAGITLSVSSAALSEAAPGKATITVTATVDGATRFATTHEVPLSLSGTATADADYTHDPLPTIAIAAGAQRGTAELTLTVRDDHVDEADRETIVVGTAGAASPSVGSATISLADNDGAGVTVSRVAATVPAGGSVSYQVSLQSRPTHPVTVNLGVPNQDAATVSPAQLVFGATEDWNEPIAVTITDADDADTLDGELTISHTLTSTDPNYDDAAAPPVTATVRDHDVPVLSVSVIHATEGTENARLQFVVSLTPADDQQSRVSYATSNGTATAGADYDAANGELVFAVGETRKTVTVNVRDDNAYEGANAETLTLTLSGTVNAALSGDFSGGLGFEGRIADDETAPTGIVLNVSPTTVRENAGAVARRITVRATLQSANPLATARTVTVSFSDPADASNLSVVRYADPEDIELVLAVGAMQAEVEFVLAPVDDVIGGQTDAVISVTGTDSGTLPVTAVVLTVEDDDNEPTGIALNVSSAALSETAPGKATITVTATVDGATRFATPHTINLYLSGTATLGADYTHDPLPTLVIAAGARRGTAELVLHVRDDQVDENDPETIIVGAAGAPSPQVRSATINLADNDGAGAMLSRAALTVPAGGAASYQVSLQSRPTHPVTVNLGVPEQDAATVTPTRLVFPATDAWNDPIGVTITDAGDANTTDDELAITHALTSADPNYNDATASPVTATVQDDDAPVVSATSEPEAREAEGAALEFMVQIPAIDDQDVTVAYETRNGTATAGADYTAKSGTLTIEADDRSATVRVELLDDGLAEDRETVLLVLTARTNAALPEGREELVITGTIRDDETAPTELTLGISPQRIAEGDGTTEVVVTAAIVDAAPFDAPHEVTVSLSPPLSLPGQGNRAVVGHQVAPPLSIIIPAGATQASGTLTLTPVNDDVSGQSSAEIEVSGDAGGGIAVRPTTLTITDDDQSELSVRVTGIAYENADPGELTFEVSTTKPSAVDMEVEFETADGTAVAGADYQHAAGVLTIAADSRSGVVRVTLHDDNLYEGDETLSVILRNPTHAVLSGNVARLEAQGTIGDDEAAAQGITLSAHPPELSEAAGETIVTITAAVAGNTPFDRRRTIALSLTGTAEPPGDYEPLSPPVIVIEAGSSSGTARLPFTPIDDALAEAAIETVVVGGAVLPDDNAGDLLVTSATLRLIDNDVAVLSATAAPAREDADPAELVFELALSAPSDGAVEVEFETRDVEGAAGTATVGDDYHKTAGTLTIAPGDRSATVRVRVRDDALYEGPERLELVLRNAVNAAFASAEATLVVAGTIHDDEFDAAGVELTMQPPSLFETDGPTPITVVATLVGSAPFQDRRTITLALSGTALIGTDYEPPDPPAIVIEAGTTNGTVTFTLTPFNDDLDEPDTETIIIDGAVDAGAAELPVSPATLALRDDDQAGLVVTTPALDDAGGAVSASSPITVPEGSTTVYSVALNSEPFASTQVTLRSSHPDKATILPAQLTFTAADWNRARQITITGEQDDDVLDDAVTVIHTSSSDGGYPSLEVLTPVLIADDDVPRLAAIDHVSIPKRTGVYGFGEDIRLVLTFTRPVRVEGAPQLRLTMGDEPRFAEYQSGSFAAELLFAYTVRENDEARTGPRILANPVRRDEGTAITDVEHASIDAITQWNTVIDIPVRVNGNMDPLLAAHAGEDIEVTEVTAAERAAGATEAVVTLDGSGSTTAQPEHLAYAWTASPENPVQVSLRDADTAAAHFTVPNLAQDARLEFVLTVTNTRTDEHDSDAVTVTIRAVNEAPVADAGEDQTVAENTPVTLDGSGSSDPEGLPLTYAWRTIGNAHGVRLVGADTPHPTFTAPAQLLTDTALTFELTVTDHAGLTHADTVTVTTRAFDMNPVMRHALAAFGRAVGSSAVDALGERFDDSGRLSPVFGIGTQTPASNPVENVAMNWGAQTSPELLPGPVWNEHRIGTPLALGNGVLPWRNPLSNGGFKLALGKWWGKDKDKKQNKKTRTRADESGAGPAPDPEPTALEPLPDAPNGGMGGSSAAGGYYEDDYYASRAAEQDAAAPKWTLWGRGDMRSFDGKPMQTLSLNGSMTASYIGIDRRLGERGIAGVAVSMTGSGMDYTYGAVNGKVDMNLRSVLPYARWRFDRGLDAWGIVGSGSGSAEIATDYGRRAQADLSMRMLALGLHQALVTICGIDVSAKGDALTLNLDAQATSDQDDLEDLQASVSRLRLALESRGVLVLSRTAQLRPSLELAARIDGGDAETGFGTEALGGLSYVNARSGITMEARGRYLLMHASGDLKQWGASLSLEWDPGAQGGLGLSLEPVWGDMGTGSPSARWQADDPFDIPTPTTGPTAINPGSIGSSGGRPDSMQASVRYELNISDWRLRPYATLDMNGDRRHRRTGLYLEALELNNGEMNLDLFGERSGDGAPFGYGLEANLRLSVH